MVATFSLSLSLSLSLAALDQLSKFAVTRRLIAGDSIELTPFFNLVRVHNRGAALLVWDALRPHQSHNG